MCISLSLSAFDTFTGSVTNKFHPITLDISRFRHVDIVFKNTINEDDCQSPRAPERNTLV